MAGVLLSGHYTEIADKIKRNLEKQKKLRRNNSLIWRVELGITRRFRKNSVCIKAVLVWLKYCRNLWILLGANIWAIDLFELQLTSNWGTYTLLSFSGDTTCHQKKRPNPKKPLKKPNHFYIKTGFSCSLSQTSELLLQIGKWRSDFLRIVIFLSKGRGEFCV